MGLSQLHALPRDQRFFAQPEVTPGTFVRATSTSAFKAKKFAASYDQDRIDRTDNRASRSLYERIDGKYKVDWEIDSYVIPSGTAGTAPDQEDLYQAGFGTETVSGGVSVTYSLNSTQSGRQTVSLTRWAQIVMETLRGCNVNSIKFSGKGGDPFMVNFKGQAWGLCYTGSSTLNGAVVASATNIVQTVDQYNFEAHATFGSIVQVGANTNGGTGYMVTGRSGASLTLEASSSSADAADVLPYAPSETCVGSPIGGIVGSLTVDSVSIPIVGFEVELNNNDKVIDDESFVSGPTEIIPGARSVTGSFDIRIRRDMTRYIGHRKNSSFTTRDIALVMGTTAGRIATINIDYAEVKFSSLEFGGEDDSATLNVPFVARASTSTAADEMTLVFT
jgi:hypothetical protein